MTYEPKHKPGGFDWAADMQRRIDADTASTSRVERLRATIADIERKRGPAPATAPKPKQYAPGPQQRKVAPMVEALKRARRGDIGQALGVEQVDVHKLPPHVTYG